MSSLLDPYTELSSCEADVEWVDSEHGDASTFSHTVRKQKDSGKYCFRCQIVTLSL